MGFTIDEYIEAKRLGLPHAGRKAAPSTLGTFTKVLRRVERLAGKPLAEIGADDIEPILRAAEADGIAENTKNQMVSVATSAFAWAIGTDRYAGKNPFAAVPFVRVEREIKDVLSREEVDQLIAAMEANERAKFDRVPEGSLVRNTGWFQAGPTSKYTLLTKLLYFGGLRLGEARGLLKAGVKHDHVRIQGKGGKWRLVPLPDDVMTELRAYVKAHPHTDFVFYGEHGQARGVDTGKPMREMTYYKVFEEALATAGLPAHLTPHSLRHSAATHVQEAMNDLSITSRFLGHASVTTTMIYVHTANSQVKQACAAAFGT